MAENSTIEWTHHTFNPWSGCTKVSAGCANCYAEVNYSVKMRGVKWGPQGNRIVKAESGWKEPLKWDREAKAAGERRRVFCASLADVFEDWTGPMCNSGGQPKVRLTMNGQEIWPNQLNEHEPLLTMQDVRNRLFALIDATPNLDWLILTKRPENIAKMMPAYFPGGYVAEAGTMNQEGTRPNVWLGASVENQKAADERLPDLLSIPAAVRFLSVEPLLGPVEFSDVSRRSDAVKQLGKRSLDGIDWVIIGGESGAHARPCDIAWIRSIVEQCKAAGLACFVKQLGGNLSDYDSSACARASGKSMQHDKGGDPSEWPESLRVREFPSTEPALHG